MSRTRITHKFNVCPACRSEIQVTLTVDLDVSDVEDDGTDNISLDGKIIGAAISHDCTPQVTR